MKTPNKTEMKLVLLNAQGASEAYLVASKAEARRIVRTWVDPQNLTARLFADGVEVYNGSARGLK